MEKLFFGWHIYMRSVVSFFYVPVTLVSSLGFPFLFMRLMLFFSFFCSFIGSLRKLKSVLPKKEKETGLFLQSYSKFPGIILSSTAKTNHHF
jgi:hypothetical protein